MGNYKNPIPSVEDEEKVVKIETDEPENDYKCIEPVYFAFIDVLGFKKNFDDNHYNKDNEYADKYRDVFNYYFELMDATNFIQYNKECYAGQTSDSLYFYTSSAEFLIEFIKIFSHFSLYAMTKDVFFRGGIAKGKLFSKQRYQFYGDSVINAYLLESVIAKYPLVFIAENIYKEIKDFDDCKILINSENGRYYIKPFVWLTKKEQIRLDINKSSLIEIRDIDKSKILEYLEKNKDNFEYDEKNYNKYLFLLNEFKKTCI